MSSGDAASPLRMSVATFAQRLAGELEATDWRALILVVVARPELVAAVDEVVSEAAAGHGIAEDRVLRCVVSRDAGGRGCLQAYNRGRDSLIKDKRVIYLRAGSAADVRFLREVAPDLSAAIDLFAELDEPALDEASWPTCSAALRALMEERNSTLDFTGLLPASVEQRVLPLQELYQSLVEFRPTATLFDRPAHGGCLVLGHPGSGKTTYLRHLAWTYAGGRADPLELGGKVPLLLSLSDYGEARAQDRVRSLIAFLPHYLAEQEVAHASTITEHLPEVLLLLDGLDELPGVELRRAVLSELRSLLAEGAVGGVVVTGRSFLVDELGRQDHLRLATTRPPSSEQMRAFVTTFVRLRQGARAHASELIARIERDPDLRVLARTPLMLAFMVILDELEGRLPDRRIEIYYRLGEMLVDRWTRVRSIGTSGSRRERPTRADAMRVLGPLAWWTLERGGGAVAEQGLLEEIVRIEERREPPPEARRRAVALLELLRADTALLVPRSGRRWSFVHQSIAEYFAGVEVERDPQRWAALLADPLRSDWREVVLFCAGQLGVIDGRTDSLDRLIDTILKKARRKGRYDAKYPSLLIGLLLESPGLSRKQVDRLVTRLLELVFTMAFSIKATFQVQGEFVELMRDARGSAARSLAESLRRLLRTADRVRWDRVFWLGDQAHILDLDEFRARWPDATVRWVVRGMLEPLGESLVDPWVRDWDIDLEPSIARWSKRDTWPYRLAIWWVRSTPEQRELPFAQIADQLQPSSDHG